MTNILNAQEAFTALQKGKTVLCRYAGDGTLHADKDFSTLDQMPATVFALPNYEFCIQVEMLELAGITFTKPMNVDDLEVGTEVFVVNPAGFIMQCTYQGIGDAIITMVDSGFAQRDLDNARLQYEALCKMLGGNAIKLAPVKTTQDLEADTKVTKKRASKKQNDSNCVGQQSTHAANDEVSLDDIIGPVGDQKPTSNDVEKKTLDEIATQSEIQNNPTSFDAVAAAVVNKAKEIDEVTLENNSKKLANDESEYQEKLATLKQRVDESKTPTEVNAVVKYTNLWTEEQRAPLLQYMHKRLEVLQQSKSTEQPSLMVRIQNASDLTVLDALEIDVSSLDPVIQPEMMRYVRTRRLELEKALSVAINDEDLP
ncbi:hypothetical protein QM294_06830 [Acinetobacter junii]|uniref:hypothetical protein n=1 Tax=Acinetobacter junii TaxID=40215 RepID=UPI00244C494B|nr:hypothetical protein [Acinetobacter junii]MDH1690850.1 hypothetical protein [Acinetobacter junii]MDI9720535.1 hypothetical protein [Acinetobacter junii]